MKTMHVDPLFDPLRSHPRYHALIGILQRFFLLKTEKIELLPVFYFHIA